MNFTAKDLARFSGLALPKNTPGRMADLLREALNFAVKNEYYEAAARIRDAIKERELKLKK